MTERDDRWFRLTLFAVRLEGENGWIVDEAPFPLPDIEARIRGTVMTSPKYERSAPD
jgi:hypothetical protein